jgi:hypothetical protein
MALKFDSNIQESSSFLAQMFHSLSLSHGTLTYHHFAKREATERDTENLPRIRKEFSENSV